MSRRKRQRRDKRAPIPDFDEQPPANERVFLFKEEKYEGLD